MIIGIDASRAFGRFPTGIELYSRFLIYYLRTPLKNTHVVLYVRKGTEIPFSLPRSWEIRSIGWPFLWTQGGLSWEMYRRKPDVLFVTSYIFPWCGGKKNILVVHGLEYEEYPQGYSFLSRMRMRFLIRTSIRQAFHIIVVSQRTKELLKKYYKISQHTSVVYEGLPVNKSVQKKSFRKKPFFLVIGRVELRKNIIGIIEAFERFQKQNDRSYRLLLVGSKGYGYRKIQKRIQESSSKQHIIHKGYVGDEEKRRLLAQSQALLFLSFAEGFGLPILEAQRFGIPLIVSDIPIFREIAGRGAYFVNPRKKESIAHTLREVVRPSPKKDAILQAGRENILRFSWEKCAQEISKILIRSGKN